MDATLQQPPADADAAIVTDNSVGVQKTSPNATMQETVSLRPQRLSKKAAQASEDEGSQSESEDDYAPKAAPQTLSRSTSQPNLSFWAPAEATREKGKLRQTGENGVAVRSELGLNALEPSNRNGAAARNVSTANGNFAVLEDGLKKANVKIDKLAAELFLRIGGVSETIGNVDSQCREAIGALSDGPPKRANASKRVPDEEDSDIEVVEVATPRAAPKNSSRAKSAQDAPATSQVDSSTANMIKLLKAKITAMEIEQSANSSKAHIPASFVINTRQPDPAPAHVQPTTFLQQVHALAAARMAPEGFAPRPAAPIEAIESNPEAAQLAVMEAYMYDLMQKVGNRQQQQQQQLVQQPFLPEMFMPSMTSAAATAPRVQQVATGSKRKLEDSPTFGNGLQTYSDVDNKRQRFDTFRPAATRAQTDSEGGYVKIGPWNFGRKVKDLRETITNMCNSLPQSHLVRIPSTILRCANAQYVVVHLKKAGEAETLIRAWGQRGPALAECAAVTCPPDEVPPPFSGNGF